MVTATVLHHSGRLSGGGGRGAVSQFSHHLPMRKQQITIYRRCPNNNTSTGTGMGMGMRTDRNMNGCREFGRPSRASIISIRRRRRNNASYTCFSGLCSSSNVVQFMDIIHNKVLIAAAVSAAIGQFSKPFTSTFLSGGSFDFSKAFQAGGFPSTHSSAAVATATTLGLERGLADSIFGLAVVYACLIMYDAQGVRREVGIHAKSLNKVLFKSKPDTDSSGDPKTESLRGELSPNLDAKRLKSFQPRGGNASLMHKVDTRTESTQLEASSSSRLASDLRRESEGSIPFGCGALKESVGHTEVEVIAGALLGFSVGVAVCSI